VACFMAQNITGVAGIEGMRKVKFSIVNALEQP
jgi:hypothetical protein